jgi:hypothetical protein
MRVILQQRAAYGASESSVLYVLVSTMVQIKALSLEDNDKLKNKATTYWSCSPGQNDSREASSRGFVFITDGLCGISLHDYKPQAMALDSAEQEQGTTVPSRIPSAALL